MLWLLPGPGDVSVLWEEERDLGVNRVAQSSLHPSPTAALDLAEPPEKGAVHLSVCRHKALTAQPPPTMAAGAGLLLPGWLPGGVARDTGELRACACFLWRRLAWDGPVFRER